MTDRRLARRTSLRASSFPIVFSLRFLHFRFLRLLSNFHRLKTGTPEVVLTTYAGTPHTIISLATKTDNSQSLTIRLNRSHVRSFDRALYYHAGRFCFWSYTLLDACAAAVIQLPPPDSRSPPLPLVTSQKLSVPSLLVCFQCYLCCCCCCTGYCVLPLFYPLNASSCTHPPGGTQKNGSYYPLGLSPLLRRTLCMRRIPDERNGSYIVT